MKKLTITQKAENAVKWMNVMTYGNNKQQKSMLGDAEGGYCCLGLGHCRILPKDSLYDPEWADSPEFAKAVGLLTNGGVPQALYTEDKYLPIEVRTEFIEFLESVKSASHANAKYGHSRANAALTNLNDAMNFNFKEISKVLRTYPEYYFEPKVAAKIKKLLKKKPSKAA